jgi:hypothetical protein
MIMSFIAEKVLELPSHIELASLKPLEPYHRRR